MRILSWNARGLRQKFDLLSNLLRRYDIDVALISETNLSSNVDLSLDGYTICREDIHSGSRAQWGLVVIVKESIEFRMLPSPRSPLRSMDALGVKLKNSSFRVFAAYRSPKQRLDLDDIARLLLDKRTPTLIAGDLNCTHPTWDRLSTANADGKRLYEDSLANGYTVSGPKKPTRYPACTENASNTCGHRAATLDIIIHCGLDNQTIKQQTLADNMGSDHQPVLITITD